VGLAVLSGCRRQVAQVSDLTITHEVSPQPPRVGPTTITLKLTDAAGKPVSGARITLEGNMSHAGMAPVVAEAKEAGQGSYRANVELSMAGDWVMIAHVTLTDGRKLDHQFALNGVAPS
jgi:hypothetical protein